MNHKYGKQEALITLRCWPPLHPTPNSHTRFSLAPPIPHPRLFLTTPPHPSLASLLPRLVCENIVYPKISSYNGRY
ncbi:hypothetical protein E2C01_082150 [Portunus trituberculatus]|uniref:Uncharacterized protein n=1 Tax=Portunus trituberculatus TaxID=210409 RepID=A0A5B7ITS3_PORTR|nr:hypothetical protein [Portunus trituberculatus]